MFYYDVLLLTTAYAVHFFLGQFPNMELMLSPLFYLLNCYIVAIASLRLLSNSVFDWLSLDARLTT